MAKVTFFAGLCGSGKSYESKELKWQYLERGQEVKMFREVLNPNIEPQIIQTLKEGIDCIVEEAYYCMPDCRNRILQMLDQEVPDAEIKFVLFENNLKVANWNVQNRTYDFEAVARLIENERLRLLQLNGEYHKKYNEGDFPTKTIFRI